MVHGDINRTGLLTLMELRQAVATIKAMVELGKDSGSKSITVVYSLSQFTYTVDSELTVTTYNKNSVGEKMTAEKVREH